MSLRARKSWCEHSVYRNSVMRSRSEMLCASVIKSDGTTDELNCIKRSLAIPMSKMCLPMNSSVSVNSILLEDVAALLWYSFIFAVANLLAMLVRD